MPELADPVLPVTISIQKADSSRFGIAASDWAQFDTTAIFLPLLRGVEERDGVRRRFFSSSSKPLSPSPLPAWAGRGSRWQCQVAPISSGSGGNSKTGAALAPKSSLFNLPDAAFSAHGIESRVRICGGGSPGHLPQESFNRCVMSIDTYRPIRKQRLFLNNNLLAKQMHLSGERFANSSNTNAL